MPPCNYIIITSDYKKCTPVKEYIFIYSQIQLSFCRTYQKTYEAFQELCLKKYRHHLQAGHRFKVDLQLYYLLTFHPLPCTSLLSLFPQEPLCLCLQVYLHTLFYQNKQRFIWIVLKNTHRHTPMGNWFF